MTPVGLKIVDDKLLHPSYLGIRDRNSKLTQIFVKLEAKFNKKQNPELADILDSW